MTFATGEWGEQAKERSEKRKAYFREYARKYRALNGVHKNNNAHQTTWRQALRKKLLAAMGDKCVKCGFTDPRALQIDHVHGGGRLDRSKHGPRFMLIVLRSVEAGEKTYQLLCANCNFIKRDENNELRRSSN